METDAQPGASAAHPTDNTGIAGAAGDPRVAAQLHTLDALEGLPVGEHVEVFETVHRTLSEILSTIDTDSESVENSPPSAPMR